MPEKGPKCLGQGEYKLTMRQIQQYLVSQLFGEQQSTFLTAGWTKVESLAGKGTKIVVAAFRVGAPDSHNPLKIVTACGKLLSDLLDSIKAEHAVFCSIFLIILFAEVCKVMFKDFMEFVSASGYIIIPGKRKSSVPK